MKLGNLFKTTMQSYKFAFIISKKSVQNKPYTSMLYFWKTNFPSVSIGIIKRTYIKEMLSRCPWKCISVGDENKFATKY